MNLSKKHIKLAIQKDASMIACTPICSRLMYWKKKNRLSYDELAYLVNDGWHLEKNPSKSFKLHSSAVYGKAVKELM